MVFTADNEQLINTLK